MANRTSRSTALAAPRRVPIAVALIALWTVATLTLGAGPASAHDQLLASNPAHDAALETAPAEITLDYSDSVLTIGAIVLLVDKDEKNWVDGEPQLEGPRVTALVSGDPPDGTYEVRWRVVSIDGHPISGIIPFTIGDVEPATPVTPRDQSTIEPSASAAVAPSSSLGDDSMRTVLVGMGGAAAAVLLFWAVTAWNQRRQASRTPKTPSP